MDLGVPSMALDARFPAGMTALDKSDKVELSNCHSSNRPFQDDRMIK
jgi:hypothetical protein